jgi:hypothetical protein
MTSSMTQNVMTSFDMTSFDVRMIVQFSWEYRYFVLSNYKCVNDIISYLPMFSICSAYMNNESECFTGISGSKHEKTMYRYPFETRARVVYMASQMNRDVIECFSLLIWIEFLTKHNVIRNSIQVILHA